MKSARICRSIGSPPKVPQTRDPEPVVSFCSSPTICCVSSRVGARMMAWGPRPRDFEHLDQRDAERRGLARTRLGLADDVESIERFGNEGRLNGGGRKVAGVLEGLEHVAGSGPWMGTPRGFLFNSSNQSILQKHSSVRFVV